MTPTLHPARHDAGRSTTGDTATTIAAPSRATSRRRAVTRRGFGLTALGILGLSACSVGPKTAQFEDGGGSDDGGSDDGKDSASAAPTAHVDPGFFLDEIDQDVTTTKTLKPQHSTIITPAGTLVLKGLYEAASLPADVLGLEPVEGDDGEPMDYSAAEGEVFRILELAFTAPGDDGDEVPDGSEGSGQPDEEDKTPEASASISIGGTQTHLADLSDQYSQRMLVSAAQDGSTTVVVSCDGHDQSLDVATGERAADDVTAAYYRSTTRQEPHHTFTVDQKTFTITYDGKDDSELTVDLTYQINALTLTAWAAGKGWADADKAWLVVDWDSFTVVGGDLNMESLIKDLTAKISVDVDGKSSSDELHLKKQLAGVENKDPVTSAFEVPVDMTEAKVSVSGTYTVGLRNPGYSYEIAKPTDGKFSTKGLTVKFPDDGSGNGPAGTPGSGSSESGASDGGGQPTSDGGGASDAGGDAQGS